MYILGDKKIVCSKSVVFESEKPGAAYALFPVEEKVENVAAQSDSERNDDWFDADDKAVQDNNETLREESLHKPPYISPPNLWDRATIKAPDRFVYAMPSEIPKPISYQELLNQQRRSNGKRRCEKK